MSCDTSLSFHRATSLLAALLLFLALAPAAWADGWLGVQVTAVPEDLVRHYGLPQGVGAYVADVLPGSPAARGGIVPGDILVRIDDELQYSPAILVPSRAPLLAGRTVSVLVFRGDAALVRPVILSEAPAQPPLPGERREAAAELPLGTRQP